MPDISKRVLPMEGKKLTPRYAYDTAKYEDTLTSRNYRSITVTPADLLDMLKHRTCSAVCVTSANFGLVELGVRYAVQKVADKLKPSPYRTDGLSEVAAWEKKISAQADLDLTCYVNVTISKVENAKHENYHIWIHGWGTQIFGETDSYYKFEN